MAYQSDGTETIYVVRGRGTNYFKIGRTANDVSYRIAQLQTGCPFEIEAYKTFKTAQPGMTERRLHDRLAEYRVKGEWFDVDVSVIDLALAELNNPDDSFLPLSVARDPILGWNIRLNRWSVAEDGGILIGPRCVTSGEIEYYCSEIITAALSIIAAARRREAAGFPLLTSISDPK